MSIQAAYDELERWWFTPQDARDLAIFLETDRRATNFRSQLYRLIAKADVGNTERLRAGFPQEVAAWRLYMAVGLVGLRAFTEPDDRMAVDRVVAIQAAVKKGRDSG